MKLSELTSGEKHLLMGILNHKFGRDKEAIAKWAEKQKDRNLTSAEWTALIMRLPSPTASSEMIDSIELAKKTFSTLDDDL
jgi:hypothetical protein